MKNKTLIKKIIPHLLAFFSFLLIAYIYAAPVLKGKTLAQHDLIQAQAAAKEINDYREKTGEQSLWTNSMFGGMPGYMISSKYPNSLPTQIGTFIYQTFPQPVSILIICMIGFYILMLALGVNSWLSVLGAIGFTFCSANMISIEAGHISKVIAIGFVPPILAGVILCYRGKYLIGGAITGLFLGLELYGNHPQITYYAFIALLIFGVYELIHALRENRIKQFLTASAVLVVVGLVATGTHASRLWTNYEYSQETTRGKSELTLSADSTQPAPKKEGGLDRDYAFNWSYGIVETGTLLIPNFNGGSSQGAVGESSNTVKTLISKGVPKEQATQFAEHLPLYWGDQPGVGGPAYAGAIICFLFVLGMFIVKDRIKWWALGIAVLFMALAWGKNFAVFNNLMFDYFPMYNKFRAVTMLTALVQLFMCLVAVMGVQALVNQPWKMTELKKPLQWSLGLTAGLALLFAIAGSVFFDFKGQADVEYTASYAQMTGSQEFAAQIMSAVQEDRASIFRIDAFRSALFILLVAGLIWLLINQKIKDLVFYAGMILLVLIDMFAVDKRYLNNDDFVSKSQAREVVVPTQANLQILQDTDPDFRVINVTVSPFQDATTSYFHKSIGGYHGAKLGRYQELYEHQIAKNNMSVLNMLNTKYFIVPGQPNPQAPEGQQQGGQPVAQRNPGAMGHAWFVNSFQIVADANAEMKALDKFDPKQTAFIDKRYESQLTGLQLQPDSAATIALTSYKPNHLTYEANTSREQLAIFSEIYYNDKKGWEVYLDGKPASHFRADYVLRAMRIPAGKHIIEFKFRPQSYETGEQIALICSIMLVGLLLAAVVVEMRKKQVKQVA